jgi:hypothetical protein
LFVRDQNWKTPILTGRIIIRTIAIHKNIITMICGERIRVTNRPGSIIWRISDL